MNNKLASRQFDGINVDNGNRKVWEHGDLDQIESDIQRLGQSKSSQVIVTSSL